MSAEDIKHHQGYGFGLGSVFTGAVTLVLLIVIRKCDPSVETDAVARVHEWGWPTAGFFLIVLFLVAVLARIAASRA